MKKTIIVFNNMRVGGIQKALIAYLKDITQKQNVTLLLFHKHGELLREIPSKTCIKEVDSDYKYMGMMQSDCVLFRDKLKRAFYAIICKILGKKVALWLISKTERYIDEEEYDEAISFIHVTYMHSLYGGAPQYVLGLKKAKKKICYVHCDYLNSGTRSVYSDNVYRQFDEIVCVSNSTKELFLKALPEMQGRVMVRYNSIDKDEIITKSRNNPYQYDLEYINCITVARLGKEKGIIRVIKAIAHIASKRLRYYIIGDGKERSVIEETIIQLGLSENILLMGEQDNPYKFMRNADIMIVPSYHEAAPVVFQEAIVLGLPILATRTSSADELIGIGNGIVIENSDIAIEEELRNIINTPGQLIRRFQQ